MSVAADSLFVPTPCSQVQAATCLLLSANYGVALIKFRKMPAAAIAEKLNKPLKWVSLFNVFLHGMTAFWAFAALASLFPTPIAL